MPAVQYPNPNKPFKLFTDASKHSYSGILHQEKEEQADTDEPELIPIAYFSGIFNKTQQLWNTTQKECYAVYQSVQKFAFYLTGTDCTLCCELLISSIFLYYRNVKPCFRLMGIRTTSVQQWSLSTFKARKT